MIRAVSRTWRQLQLSHELNLVGQVMVLDWWIGCMGYGLVDWWVWSSKFCDFFFFFFFCRYYRCLKEEVGMAEMGHGSLKSSVGHGLWVSQV